MKQSNRIIRRETPADYAAVERLTREALEQTAVGEETVLTGGAERLRAVPLPQESSKTRQRACCRSQNLPHPLSPAGSEITGWRRLAMIFCS